MKTLGYIKCEIEEIEIGKKYYLGQLSNKCTINEDCTVAMYDEEAGEWVIIEFEVISIDEDAVFNTLVKVVDIY